jgi:hypothetical protein
MAIRALFMRGPGMPGPYTMQEESIFMKNTVRILSRLE